MNRLYIFLLLLAGTFSVSAQIVDAEGQYVDTVFNDNVDRTAEDFVIASLVIADPGLELYSVLGHACLRLRCPAFGMDYCFSYEGEDASRKVLSFLAGKLEMGLYAIPVADYCATYREVGRGVYEYTLNLPIDVKRELWRVLDEQVAEGIHLSYDYFERGCAITCVDFVKKALGETVIIYDRLLYENVPSGRDLGKKYTEENLWMRFIICFIGGSDLDEPLIGDRQLIVPADLVHAWQQAKVNGEPLLASEPTVLVAGEPQVADGWFTPLVLATILLILSIANLFWNRPYFDWLMLAAQTIVGCGMTYLICFSDLCCTDWNWLLIPFNPLPALFWHWRKYWALPYVGILAAWCIVMIAMTLWGHILVDWSHIVIVVAWILIGFKQSRNIKQRNRCE